LSEPTWRQAPRSRPKVKEWLTLFKLKANDKDSAAPNLINRAQIFRLETGLFQSGRGKRIPVSS
jgi:hypothetical protein